MKIERELIERMSIQSFARREDLVMEVKERERDTLDSFRDISPIYADFRGVSLVEGSFLVGAHGNGQTEKEAIIDYMNQISGKKIKIESFNYPNRKENSYVRVPYLYYDEEDNN